MTNLLESCRVTPPPGAVAEQSLSFTFLDIVWLHFLPIKRLLFYEFPCSNPYFLETLVPKLKESLSVTLKHFFPLAANIIHHPERKPVIRYLSGDSVSLTISESTDDFDILVGNHARDADIFYEFIPQLPLISDESGQKVVEVLALQVTLFPGRGVCIGFANHHGAGDASSVVGFIRSWASINKLGGEEEFLIAQGESLPVFDRSLIKCPEELDTIFWNYVKNVPVALPSSPLPTNRVRATYVFSQSKLKKLKDLVRERFPGIVHVSSFVVMAAYVWTCLAKSIVTGGQEKVGEDEPEFFLFAIDLRGRIDPPVPENYFGNCISYGLVKIRHGELIGDEGFFLAAQTMADEIKNRANNKEKILEGVETWIPEVQAIIQNRILSVSGSARVDLYGADFGWGKARKLETLSIDTEKYSMSLCKSRDSDGGLEVGLSLPKVIMDAFTALFSDGNKSK